MLAYAPRPRRTFSPGSLALVTALHVGVFAAAMLVRTDYVPWVPKPPIELIQVKMPPPPAPVDKPKPKPVPNLAAVDVLVPIPSQGPKVETLPPLDLVTVDPLPPVAFGPVHTGGAPAFVAASLRTAGVALLPPYPASKQRIGEEATLRLSLEIDERGRVTSVAPVGTADPIFFQAAERHIKQVWRYSPATEGGRRVASSKIVTLRFALAD